jgi:tetratricopeptide (TPR) repeat protein
MKTVLIKGLLAGAMIVYLALNSIAQSNTDPNFGPDEETRKQCMINLSLYGEDYKQGNYAKAKSSWQKVLKICPAARQNPYIHGVRMLKTWIAEATTPSRKKELIDSLMMVYDMRIKYFNKRGTVLGSKAVDLISLDSERYQEAYDMLKESISLEKGASEASIIYAYMAVSKTMYENRAIPAITVIETYALLADYLDAQINAKPDDGKLIQIKEDIDAIFIAVGVADCNNLQTIFEPKFDSNPKDAELVKKIHTLLKSNRCEKTDFYKKVLIGQFSNAPTSLLAYEIAKNFKDQNDFAKAEEYYKQAIELENDAVRKSMFLVEYGSLVFTELRNPQQARTLALQAIDANPNIGHAYILIGNIYASEKSCFSDPFQAKTVFWVAVDKFMKAKQVDPSLASDCDRYISTYTQYFPPQNDIFFQDLTIGQKYNVECWIKESTTVRARP